MAEVKTNKALLKFMGELCYIRRKMRNFNEEDFMSAFKSIVIDEAFVVEDGVERFVGTIRTKAHPVTPDQVKALFTAIGKSVSHTEDWLIEYDALKENALFIDTTTPKYEGGLCVFNTLPEDWVKSNH